MRCPDCNKFTGLENGDPEVQNSEANYSEGCFTLTFSVRGTRLCADCWGELKSLDMDIEETVDLGEMESYKALSKDQQERILNALNDCTAEIELSEEGTNVDETGGGRYKKNMITTEVSYELTIRVEGEKPEDTIELCHTGEVSNEAAAGEYEECC